MEHKDGKKVLPMLSFRCGTSVSPATEVMACSSDWWRLYVIGETPTSKIS